MNHAFTGLAILVATSGFLNLSYELLWVRAYAFSIKGAGPAFALLLGAYLMGLALGSAGVTRLTKRYATRDARSLRAVAIFIGIGNIVGYLALPVMGWIAASLSGPDLLYLLLPTLVASTFLGTHFPLLAHYGVRADGDAGFNVSILYVCNIVGSVTGSLVMGFVLMDHFGLSTMAAALGVIAMLIAATVYFVADSDPKHRASAVVVCGLMIGALLLVHDAAFVRLYDRLLFYSEWEQESPIARTIENRSGVISILADGRIFGGGVYDGDFSVDLVHDKNGIIRPFSISAFHPNPKRVLVGGLGSGSWARVVADHPQVEDVVVVEINPGYLEAVRGTEGEAILTHPKVTLVTDDLRRYLRLHPQKFDVLVFNMTFNWRSMATTVLSVEFFEIVKSRLNPDGLFIINATGNPRVFKSATMVFGEVNRLANAVAATPTKFALSPDRLRRVLGRYKVGGDLVIDPTQPEDQAKLNRIIRMFEISRVQDTMDNFDWQDHTTILKQIEGVRPITDDNTGDEFTGF